MLGACIMYVSVHSLQIYVVFKQFKFVTIDHNKFSFLTAEVGRLKMEESVTPVKFCSERNNESEVRETSQYGH
jgi:hypothetical protein